MVDFGIRSVHLVYELLDGYDVLVLVDTVGRQEGPPGTLYVIEPELPRVPRRPVPEAMLDPHDLAPGRRDGAGRRRSAARVDRILVVGSSPRPWRTASASRTPSTAAVEPAADLVVDVVDP